MTIEEMRELVGLPEDATDAAVVAAYAALIDDGPPASITIVEPVTLDMVREQCSIDDEISDALLNQKIRSAREWVEDYTGRIVAQRSLVHHFSRWGQHLELFGRPIVSVDAISYNGVDGDGIYSAGIYSIGAHPFRIFPDTTGFPSLRTGGGIIVAYTAGYDAGEAPFSIIEAVLVIVGGMVSDREGGYDKSLRAAEQLVGRLRVQVI